MDVATQTLSLSSPSVMAILNITPDSFSDGGQLFKLGQTSWDNLFNHVELVLAQGASILDIGGESTRPGATPVTEMQELDRVIPVIEAIRQRFDCLVSVDTSTAAVMTAAVNAGAGLINDVRALSRPGALEAAVMANVPVCLMHMQGEPETMQQKPDYTNIVDEIAHYLLSRAEAFISNGGRKRHIILDPGFGFGKTFRHNQLLFRHIPQLVNMGYPLLVGVSRKTMIGHITGRGVENRVVASAIAAAIAIEKGASIVRVHDVSETIDAINTLKALGGSSK